MSSLPDSSLPPELMTMVDERILVSLNAGSWQANQTRSSFACVVAVSSLLEVLYRSDDLVTHVFIFGDRKAFTDALSHSDPLF